MNSIIQKPASGIIVTNIKCPKSNKDLFLLKDISSCLNNYFTTIASKLANSLLQIRGQSPFSHFSKI